MTLGSTTLTDANTSKFAQTDRWRLHYNEAGEGPALIMLHGSGPGAAGWSNFNANITDLAQHYRVILLDFPGWGQSDEIDPDNHDRTTANAEAIKMLMDELGIEQATLVGNSMGGMAAQMFTGLFNDRVSHCITMGAPSPILTPPFFAAGGLSEGLKILFATYADPSIDNFRRLVNIMVFNSDWATDDLIQQRAYNANLNRAHLDKFLASFKKGGMAPTPDQLALPGKLAHVDTPFLIIHGRDDRVVNVEHSLSATALVKNSTLMVFNRCGHWAQLEHAKMFNALVRGFVSSN